VTDRQTDVLMWALLNDPATSTVGGGILTDTEVMTIAPCVFVSVWRHLLIADVTGVIYRTVLDAIE